MGGEEVAEKGEKVNITLRLTALLLKGTERKLGIWNLDHSDATVDASHSSGHGVNTSETHVDVETCNLALLSFLLKCTTNL